MADPFSFALATVAQIGISYLFPSEGPRLKDLKISASTYGAAIPWVFGLTRVPGNMIWSKAIRERKKKKSGKGGSYNEYTYFCTFAMGFCKGPVKQVRRIWADSKLVYDSTGGLSASQSSNPSLKALVTGATTANSKYRLRLYMGDEEQLPDSAVETEEGAGQAPAYRGLCYVLFDDFPLEDFGNRIPQITAEVLVGETTPQVTVSALTEADGTTDFDNGYESGEGIFDFQRGYGYLRYGEGMKSFNLRTARAMQDFIPEGFGFEGSDRLSRLLCGGQDGAMYVLRGAIGSTANLDRLDPFSLQSMETKEDIPTPVVAATAITSSSIERLMTIASDGTAVIMKGLDLTQEWTGFIGGVSSAGPFKVVGRDPDTSDLANFYVFRKDGANLKLTKVNSTEQTDVFTFAGTAIGAAIWDSAVPGVLMFWSDGGTHYLSKWSEDTGEEVWRNAIPGYPTVYYGDSRLIVQQFGWVYAGNLYIIDTTSGGYIGGAFDDSNVGQIDWADYLVRYPTVLDDYYNAGGYTVASSPEAYAQYYHTNQGASEGKTLTYITNTAGQGIALADDFEGAMGNFQALDAARGLLISLDGMEGLVKASNITGGVSVGTVVSRLLQEGGLSSAQTDLSAINAIPIRGYGWAGGTDIKGIFNELKSLYLFDLVERDGLLVATVRGDPDNGLDQSVEVIPQNALGSTSEEACDFWQETRMQEADLPAIITLAYMNVDDDFETSTARSARMSNPVPTMFSRQQVAMEINVVLTATEAKVQTNKILYSQWAERTRHTSRLPWSYLNLDPGDVISVEMNDGRVYEDRLHQSEIGADYSISIEAYAQDSGAYDDWEEITNGDGGGDKTPTVLQQPGLAIPFIINTPLLRDQDDQGGAMSVYYVGLGNALQADWTGAGLFKSVNNQDFDIIVSPDTDAEWATVIGKIPPPPTGPFALDWTTELKIMPSVAWFEIESITDDELWAGGNTCIVGDEVIQFRDAVENGDGTWTLTNLLRCRRGTEYAANTHRNGEKFIFLDNSTIGYAAEVITSRGQARFYKAVASGRSLQETPMLQILYEPRDLMPYAPVQIQRSVETSTDVTITWQRRTRFGGNLMDGTGDVPLAERFEKYTVYILEDPFEGDLSRGVAPAEFRRKYEVTTNMATYTAAEQAVDGFSPGGTPLHVVVFQMSDAVGLGFPGVATINPDE